MNIEEKLFSLQDLEYRDFHAKLIPDSAPEKLIGVRTPQLRQLAKELIKNNEASDFINHLPHRYYEENQLHSFIISEIKDYDTALREVERFLPFVNNWATCDQLSPKVFKKHTDLLITEIPKWIASDKTYTVRFGIEMLMSFYLDDLFLPKYLDIIVNIQSEEYYVNMMRAWYFATALAKQYADTVKIIENKRLDIWTHNKTIQKARESRRISNEQKEYLNTLKI